MEIIRLEWIDERVYLLQIWCISLYENYANEFFSSSNIVNIIFLPLRWGLVGIWSKNLIVFIQIVGVFL